MGTGLAMDFGKFIGESDRRDILQGNAHLRSPLICSYKPSNTSCEPTTMADSLGSSCLDQKFHPTVEEFMPTDPNFYPKKKFSCNIQPPSLEDVQNMLASRMKIDENQAKICGNVKKDYKQKAHKAKETLHGKPFLGAENLEVHGNELEKHNDNVDAQFAQIQGIFLTPDTEAFIPREKLDTTSLNPVPHKQTPTATLLNPTTLYTYK
eukprot:1162936-Amorphochlora_amoeboformis.AAC.1